MIKKIATFLTHEIWRLRLDKLPRSKSILIRCLRVVILALRGFNEDKCQLRASALTFYSLLSIVPVVAMAFGVAKGFGLQKMLEQQMLERVPGQEQVLLKVVEFAKTLLENTKGGIVAGIGVAILFWTVIKVLGNIEKSFNDIWGIKKARSFGRKFSDYLSIMFICPVLVIMSSSITVFISTQIILMSDKFAVLGAFAPIISIVIKLLPYCVLWGLFTFLYLFMPNGKVNFSSGLVAGIIAGTVYQFVQWGYIAFQVGVAKYNAIYGSFAALPLFLMWLQLSWLVVLFGAEISFAYQNVDTYEFEQDCLKISYSFKRLLSLYLVHSVVKRFVDGETVLTASSISKKLEIPIRLVRQLLFELLEAGLLIEAKSKVYRESAYQPSRDIANYTISYVLEKLDGTGVDDIPVGDTKDLKKISQVLSAFKLAVGKTPENILLKDF